MIPSRFKILIIALLQGPILCALLAAEPSSQVPISGQPIVALAAIDRMMTRFIIDNQVPGAALALTKNGNLIYAHGFGLADKESQIPVAPDSVFRIASISKPITAVAVLQLVGQGKLDLSDRAFLILKIKPFMMGDNATDPRLNEITIQHLLNHTAGWDRKKSFYPLVHDGPVKIAKAMGVDPPAKPEDIIRYMMAKPLDFEPGARFAYSNLGYVILGRIIEHVSGERYESYVQRSVLAPIGIHAMQIGKTEKKFKAVKEVTYYTPDEFKKKAQFGSEKGNLVTSPYTQNIEVNDAAGGWVASIVDLARFASALDDHKRCKLVGEKSIHLMYKRPAGKAGYKQNGKPRSFYYACGWNVKQISEGKFDSWHYGLYDGSSALLYRRNDGLNAVVLFNSDRNSFGQPLHHLILKPLQEAIDAIKKWPDLNLFQIYN
jgi:N-acyl-D-amino-acid deacylase